MCKKMYADQNCYNEIKYKIQFYFSSDCTTPCYDFGVSTEYLQLTK